MRGAKALFVGLFFAGVLAESPASAQQMPESCQKEFLPMVQKRQGLIDRINNYNKKKPTAAQACGTFKELAVQNQKMGDWMTAQKEWCQIPDSMQAQFTEAQEQITKTRTTVCNAAAKQAQQIRQMRQAQQQGGGRGQPGVGSGVRLPQGAL